MPTPRILEIDLREVLAEMNKKLDRIDNNVNELKVELADVKGDIKALDGKVSSLDKRLEKVEGSQNRQIWALIVGILFAAISGVVIRFVVMGLPTT
jgi:predicted nuclease with TOPRIM domain